MFIHGGFPTSRFYNVIWLRGTLALDKGWFECGVPLALEWG